MNLVERIYASADHAGLLKPCVWRPTSGALAQQHPVGFAAPDDTVFDGLSLSTEYVMTYPASTFIGLAPHEPVDIDGVAYQVRALRAIGDGSEMRATLTRV